MAEEVADAITYGFLLLSTLGVDPEKVLLDKYEKVNNRIAAGGFGARPTEPKTYDVVVNGKVITTTIQLLSYNDVVCMAVGKPSDAVLTITYRNGGGARKEGILSRGQLIRIDQGTTFSAYNTGNA